MQKNPVPHNAAAYWRDAAGELKKPANLATAGVLSAVGLVIKTLAISFGPLLRVSFYFLTTVLSGYLYGPLVAGFAGVVVDVLGYLLNPTGPYFFGFTFNAFLNGIIYGCVLWRRPVKVWRCLAACALSIAVVSFVLNPLWLHLLYGEAYLALVWMRVPTNLVVLPVNTALSYVLLRVTERAKNRLPRQ